MAPRANAHCARWISSGRRECLDWMLIVSERHLLHDLGVMVNGSFVFGMDHDEPDVFDRTVEWTVEHGIETATYHILTPYPDTALYRRMDAENRVFHNDWDLFDTRHVVFRPRKLTAQELEVGYWRACRDFYR